MLTTQIIIKDSLNDQLVRFGDEVWAFDFRGNPVKGIYTGTDPYHSGRYSVQLDDGETRYFTKVTVSLSHLLACEIMDVEDMLRRYRALPDLNESDEASIRIGQSRLDRLKAQYEPIKAAILMKATGVEVQQTDIGPRTVITEGRHVIGVQG